MALGLGIGLSITPGRSAPGIHLYQVGCFVVVRETPPPPPPPLTQTGPYCFEVTP